MENWLFCGEKNSAELQFCRAAGLQNLPVWAMGEAVGHARMMNTGRFCKPAAWQVWGPALLFGVRDFLLLAFGRQSAGFFAQDAADAVLGEVDLGGVDTEFFFYSFRAQPAQPRAGRDEVPRQPWSARGKAESSPCHVFLVPELQR